MEPTNNVIFHNDITSNNINGIQAYDDGTGNQWDDGVEGNYWSDWTQPDADDDGIVDQPYNVDGSANSQDRFPLVYPLLQPILIADAGDDIIINIHQTVHFDGTNSSADPAIINNTWNFTYDSDDILLYGPTPSFTFHIPGNYTVTLTVRNELGSTASDRMLVTVSDPEPSVDVEPPVANAGPDDKIPVGTVFTFNGSGSHDNVGIVNHTWSFVYYARNIQLYGATPEFKFDIPGIYSISLNVSDTSGNRAVDTLRLTVKDESWPTAIAGEDIIIDQHVFARLNGRDSFDNVGIVDYTWSFTYQGETVFLYGAETGFQFDDAGDHIITLNVTDGEGNWDIDTLNVIVLDITPPLAVAGDDITVDEGETVNFNASESSDNIGIVNYTWTFRYDDTIYALYGLYPSFAFDISGAYEVSLSVRDSEGNSDTDNLTVTVLEIPRPIETDSDSDGYDDTFENLSGSDPYDPLSTPLDIDGDGVENEKDAYPDDGGKWEEDVDAGGRSAVWWVVGIVVVLVVIGIVVGVVVVSKKKDENGEGIARNDEDELGRIGDEGDVNSGRVPPGNGG